MLKLACVRGTSNFSKFFFLHNNFFSAQLVSAQRLSAIFPLPKLCSVAYVNFKCRVWYFCIEFLFDKNRYYESVWDWVFKVF